MRGHRTCRNLYNRFVAYLQYSAERNIMPNNMSAYFAVGLTKADVSNWRNGKSGTPAHKQFADDITMFFASIHEQGGVEGMINPSSGSRKPTMPCGKVGKNWKGIPALLVNGNRRALRQSGRISVPDD